MRGLGIGISVHGVGFKGLMYSTGSASWFTGGCTIDDFGVHQNSGYLFGSPYKDYSIFGSILGSPYFGRLPFPVI